MNKLIKNEQGLTLIELIGATVVFGLAFLLFSGILFSISKTSTVQGQQVEIQQIANSMVAQMESISKIDGIYEEAGYLGKFESKSWSTKHIIKSLDKNNLVELLPLAQGENPIYVSDILDTLNNRAESYQIKDSEVKVKLIQQKNENEVTNTIYSTPNYRDTFSIQVSGAILFYKEEIDFSRYYDTATGLWQIEKLLEEEQTIVYSRKFVLTYRDDQKANGEVPGNGRW